MEGFLALALAGALLLVSFLPFIAFFAVFVGLTVFILMRAKSIRNRPPPTAPPSLEPAAAARGWDYVASSGWWAHAFTVPPFGLGGAPYATDVVNGSRDSGSFVSFTLKGVQPSGSPSEVASLPWRVVAVPLGGRIPPLALTPAGRVAELLGVEVLEAGENEVFVESHAFNKRWRAGTDHPECAHAVLTSPVITALIDAPFEIYCIFFENGYLVAATGVPADGLDWIDGWLDVLERARDAVPPFVWERWSLPNP
jgi:hypothetical protein